MLVGWISVDVGKEGKVFLGTSWKKHPYLNITPWLEESMRVQWVTQIRYELVTSVRIVDVHHKNFAAWALAPLERDRLMR